MYFQSKEAGKAKTTNNWHSRILVLSFEERNILMQWFCHWAKIPTWSILNISIYAVEWLKDMDFEFGIILCLWDPKWELGAWMGDQGYLGLGLGAREVACDPLSPIDNPNTQCPSPALKLHPGTELALLSKRSYRGLCPIPQKVF